MTNLRVELREDTARLIMGWRRVRIPWAYNDSAHCWQSDDGVPLMACHAWRPDEDDGQCMRVVERMVALGYVCSLTIESGRAAAAFASGETRPVTIEEPDRRLGVLRAAVRAFEAAADAP